MAQSSSRLLLLLICLSTALMAARASVTYDGKSFMIDGKRRILISGSIHYPRSTPDMWPGLIQKAKAGGLDIIETYVFWNGHEPTQGNYDFSGRYDLVRFIKLVQQAGMYVHLRIGPYVCAEWNFGGLPVWLKYVPGMAFRTDNGPYKQAMQGFTQKIVSMMKSQSLFEPQGGPIIMAQIENEYDLVQYYLGSVGKSYSTWAAKMAVGLNIGVPWVMCKQEDAPDPVINSCNGFYCENFSPNRNYKPKMWTENWTGWLQNFGGPVPYRPVEDIAYSVARFIQNRGSFVNYYMYHGGTNFGRTSGGPFITTSYDYDAPIDEYGLTREPKWSHLKNLNLAIKRCEPALVSSDPQVSSLGSNQEAHLYQNKQSGACALFLANYDSKYTVEVTFWNTKYSLPPWSVSILPGCKYVAFNTAQVSGPSIHRRMLPVSGGFNWQSFTEVPASGADRRAFTSTGLREQLSVTWDRSDYLWYMIEVTIKASDLNSGGQWPVLRVQSAGHALEVFINGQLSGYTQGNADKPKLTFTKPVNLKVGVNKIALLSASVGLANIGLHFDQWNVGVLGPVTLSGLAAGTWDLTRQKWSYKVGMAGEYLSLHTSQGSSSVRWAGGASLAKKRPLTWYKAMIDAPGGNEPLALDMSSMGKGEVWVNGQSIGRHWASYKASGNCGTCSYAGQFSEKKCLTGCGQSSQRWYHVPRSWLKPKGNLVVVFEERGGDPSGISLVKRL